MTPAQRRAVNRRIVINAVKRRASCPLCGALHRSLDSAYNAHRGATTNKEGK